MHNKYEFSSETMQLIEELNKKRSQNIKIIEKLIKINAKDKENTDNRHIFDWVCRWLQNPYVEELQKEYDIQVLSYQKVDYESVKYDDRGSIFKNGGIFKNDLYISYYTEVYGVDDKINEAKFSFKKNKRYSFEKDGRNFRDEQTFNDVLKHYLSPFKSPEERHKSNCNALAILNIIIKHEGAGFINSGALYQLLPYSVFYNKYQLFIAFCKNDGFQFLCPRYSYVLKDKKYIDNLHPIHRLLKCGSEKKSYWDKRKIIDFASEKLKQFEDVKKIEEAYKFIPKQRQDAILTWLLCLHRKKSEHDAFRINKYIKSDILNKSEDVYEMLALQALNSTINEFEPPPTSYCVIS